MVIRAFKLFLSKGGLGQSSRHPTVVTLWTMRRAFRRRRGVWVSPPEKFDKLEARKHDFLTSGSHTGTCNRVVIQWVRLGIFKVEKMNQEGHFHQSALIFKGRTTRNKPFLLLGLSAMSCCLRHPTKHESPPKQPDHGTWRCSPAIYYRP
jgi:hypothetical protein